MLIASMEEPQGSSGQYWYCYQDRGLYEYVAHTPPSGWYLLPRSTFVSATPPPTAVGSVNLWIQLGDPDYRPHIYISSVGVWMPLVSPQFQLPPLSPNAGDIWDDLITMDTYVWDGSMWLNATRILGQHSMVSAQGPANTHQPTMPPAPLGGGAAGGLPGGGSLSSGGIQGANAPLPVYSGSFNLTAPALTNWNVTSTQQSNATISATPTNMLKIGDLVKIFPDGTIEYGLGYTPDRAAEMLWEAIADRHTTKELEDLRMKVAYAEDKGFKFPGKQKTVDPLDAWNAAMGIVGP